VKLTYEVDETKTYYVAVDLDIWSRSRLEPLAAAVGSQLFVYYVGPEGKRRYGAHFSLKSQPWPDEPNRNILRVVSIVRGLPPAAKRLWAGALIREFNLGIQAALEPRSFELHVEPRVVAAAAAIGAGIAVTVYAPYGKLEREKLGIAGRKRPQERVRRSRRAVQQGVEADKARER